jgi:hypothetical protein
VYLPGPAKSFSAVVGILTNPDSQDGSVVFSVDVGEKRVGSDRAQSANGVDLHLSPATVKSGGGQT